MEFFLEALFELIVEILGQILFELGWESLAQTLGLSKERHFPLACYGWAIIGAACGAASVLLLPHTLFRDGPRGMSLILTPLMAGVFMNFIGDHWRQAGRETTALATFWGGSLFAFSFALTRFLLLQHVGKT